MARVSGVGADKLREYAKAGAEVALRRLRIEVAAIERTFPELALRVRRRAIRKNAKTAAARTRTLSASARKAVSTRMKKYWSERRKAQAKAK